MSVYITVCAIGASIIIELYNLTRSRLRSSVSKFYCGELTTEEYIKELKKLEHWPLRFSPLFRKSIKKELSRHVSFAEDLSRGGVESIPELEEKFYNLFK